jgi:hypothetical protein
VLSTEIRKEGEWMIIIVFIYYRFLSEILRFNSLLKQKEDSKISS